MTTPRLRDAEIHRADSGPGEALLGSFGILIQGSFRNTPDRFEVRSPFDGSVVALAHHGGPEDVEAAVASVAAGFAQTRRMSSWERSDILHRISTGIQARREGFARALALEAGKPMSAALGEVDRAVFTFRVAAEEALRIYGETVPLDWLPGLEHRDARIDRVPIGPIAGITPFNYPLNLVAHKVAPALAAGCSIALRPDSQTPVSALMLGELILESGWPDAGLAVVPTRVEHAAPFVEDERIAMLSFTGSPGVGWMLKSRAGKKRVALELGGNAGTLIHHDAEIERAAQRVAWGGFGYSGQSCISVQRVYVHEDAWDEFVSEFLPLVENMRLGDPMDPDTDVGPVVDEGAASRIVSWVQEAVAQGATLLTGGDRAGTLVEPTVLADVREDMRVACDEVFGPVVSLIRYRDVDEALAKIDESRFGLQAGLFTNDLNLTHRAFEALDVGALIVNDVSTFRVDHMPYGGAKDSGFGREGLRYAIEEMTDRKVLVQVKNV